MRSTVAVDVANVSRAISADADRRIARANASGHGRVGPRHAVVARNRGALTAGARAAGGIRDVNRPIGRDLHVAMNAAVALDGIEDIDAGSERQSAIVTA